MWTARTGLGLLALVLTAPPVAAGPGVVVERVETGGATETAGLEPGDRLLAWERGEEPGQPGAAGEFHSPLDLMVIEIREAPLGPITLMGEGARGAFSLVLPPGTWRISSRPDLDADDLDTYLQAEKKADEGDFSGAVERLRSLTDSTGETPERAAWFLQQSAL